MRELAEREVCAALAARGKCLGLFPRPRQAPTPPTPNLLRLRIGAVRTLSLSLSTLVLSRRSLGALSAHSRRTLGAISAPGGLGVHCDSSLSVVAFECVPLGQGSGALAASGQ